MTQFALCLGPQTNILQGKMKLRFNLVVEMPVTANQDCGTEFVLLKASYFLFSLGVLRCHVKSQTL